MASLNRILNPTKRSVKLLVSEQPSSSWEQEQPPSPGSSSEEGDLEDYDPLAHIPHPDCPDSLVCLPDTDGRPQHTLPTILRCCILGSPRKRLTIREIYAAMEEKWAYYRTAGPTWKQSVRHHLSLNRLFERQPRPATDPGFGSYWTVNLTAPPGTKRPRKRGRPNKDGGPPQPRSKKARLVGSMEGLPPTKPRRGRPRKNEELPLEDLPLPTSIEEQLGAPPIETSTQMDEDEEEIDVLNYDDENIDELESNSGEECESEEKLLHPFERRQSLSGRLTPYDSSAGYHIISPPLPQYIPFENTSGPSVSPHFLPQDTLLDNAPGPSVSPQTSSVHTHADTEEIIDRLQMEMADLRRQSADAMSMSMQLSEQLTFTEAQLVATQVKLQEETGKRRQAEREADHAVRLLRAAEEALQQRTPMSPRHPRLQAG